MTQIINYSLPLGDRISMRENLIQTFLHETPGTGIDNMKCPHICSNVDLPVY